MGDSKQNFMTTLTIDSQGKHITKQSPLILTNQSDHLRNRVPSSHMTKDDTFLQGQALILSFLSLCGPATEELRPHQGAKDVEGTSPSQPHSVPPLAVAEVATP